MQTATNEFKKNLKNGYPMYGSCRITLTDGSEISLEKDDFLMDANGFSINKSCSGLNFFDIGDVSASELSLRIINYNGRLDECDFEGAKIDKVFVNMEMSDGTVESIPKGTFYVDTQDFNGGIVTLKAYDKIADMDKPYTGSKSGTALSLVSTIADKYGIILKSSEFNNSDYNVEIPTDSTYEYTDREILSYISQITCNYAQIDENGYLVLKWYANTVDRNIIDANSFSKPSEDIVSAGDFSEMSEKDILSAGTFVDVNNMIYVDTVFSSRNIGIADVIITGIKVKDTDDNEYMAGENGYVLTIYANPLVNSNNAQEIANRVWQVAQYTRFRPMSFDTIQNPLLEIGDCVCVLINGNYYETLITNLTFSIGKFTSITVGAESPSKNASYNAPISTSVKKAINQSANKVSALSSQFAGLITQSLGMYEIHETQADGSTITYLANKPTLAESIGGTVWRMALDIFTVTTNYQGSETVWENGFDSEGNLKANVLEVVGITADWINAGVLTGREINNGNGTFKVDTNGNCVANSFTSANANITGGSIHIETNSETDDLIILRKAGPDDVPKGLTLQPKGITLEAKTTNNTDYKMQIFWTGAIYSNLDSDGIHRRAMIAPGQAYFYYGDDSGETRIEGGKFETGKVEASKGIYVGGNPIPVNNNAHTINFEWDGANLRVYIDGTYVGNAV